MTAPAETDRLFVYGTLRPGQANHEVLAARVRRAEAARLVGFALWTCGDYPGARPAADGAVEGDLLTVDRPGPLLELLDALEAVPTLYRRERVTVTRVASGEPVEAWVYVLALRDLRGWAFLGPRWPPAGG